MWVSFALSLYLALSVSVCRASSCEMGAILCSSARRISQCQSTKSATPLSRSHKLINLWCGFQRVINASGSDRSQSRSRTRSRSQGSELGAQGQLPPIKIAVKTHYNKGASERARHREDNQPAKETNCERATCCRQHTVTAIYICIYMCMNRLYVWLMQTSQSCTTSC